MARAGSSRCLTCLGDLHRVCGCSGEAVHETAVEPLTLGVAH